MMGDQQTSGIWPLAEKTLLTNLLEPLTIRRTLEHFRILVQNKIVVMMTDNATVVAFINKQHGF